MYLSDKNRFFKEVYVIGQELDTVLSFFRTRKTFILGGECLEVKNVFTI